MPRCFAILAFIFLLTPLGLMAQNDQSTRATIEGDSAESDTTARETQRHPKRSALFSAVLPGLGQAYNHKYWKIPIIYAGLGTSVFFIVSNRNNYLKFKQYYVWDTDPDNPLKSPYYDPQTDLSGALRQQADVYREWMEYSYIALAAIYVLQVVDASVDGHLYYFDVSDDLSLRVEPSMQWNATREPTPGIAFNFRF